MHALRYAQLVFNRHLTTLAEAASDDFEDDTQAYLEHLSARYGMTMHAHAHAHAHTHAHAHAHAHAHTRVHYACTAQVWDDMTIP